MKRLIVQSPPTEGSSFGHAPSYQPSTSFEKKCDLQSVIYKKNENSFYKQSCKYREG